MLPPRPAPGLDEPVLCSRTTARSDEIYFWGMQLTGSELTWQVVREPAGTPRPAVTAHSPSAHHQAPDPHPSRWSLSGGNRGGPDRVGNQGVQPGQEKPQKGQMPPNGADEPQQAANQTNPRTG